MPALRPAGKPIGKPFTAFQPLAKPKKPERQSLVGVRYAPHKTLDYARIKAEVYAAIARLPHEDQALIPAAGTLPEVMTCLALVWLRYTFRAQIAEDGGRLRLGGSVVDIIVYLGATQTVIRVMGTWWHSSAATKAKDAMQLIFLRAKRYQVFDALEAEIYQAWVDGRLKEYVNEGIMKAA